MLRVELEEGWLLITHQDHARLAAAFAEHWGNLVFAAPEPRAEVLDAIYVHDDGWVARDQHPAITRAGKPSAFSSDLVGKYSAFEEIDLADYLSVRESALDKVEQRCAYAALLVSMHTYDLLTARADRSTIAVEELPMLNSFLRRQLVRQETLRSRIRADPHFSHEEVSDAAIMNNFRLLQATDNLSLLGCVSYMERATLLHPLATTEGGAKQVDVTALGPRIFRLDPYPFDEQRLIFEIPARYVEGTHFVSAEDLGLRLASAPVRSLTIAITA
jgi:hypothetical protein